MVQVKSDMSIRGDCWLLNLLPWPRADDMWSLWYLPFSRKVKMEHGGDSL